MNFLNINNLSMLICVMVIILLLFICSLIVSIKNKIKYDIRYKESSKNMGTLEECIIQLDKFISYEFDNYRILNLDFKDIEFINSKLEDDIMHDMIQIISDRISDELLSKLSYFYNKEAISDIIAEKVMIRTMAYTLNINNKK